MTTSATVRPRSAHYQRFSEQEYRRRWEMLSTMMDDEGVGCVVVYGSRASGTWPVLYLSNWPPTRESFLIVPRGGAPVLLVQLQNHVSCAADMSIVEDVRHGGRGERGQPDSIPTVASIISGRGLDREAIGFIGNPPAEVFSRLRDALPHSAWRPMGKTFSELTLRKSDEEIARLRAAAKVTDAATLSLSERLRPGMTESDIAALLEQGCREAGGGFGIRHVMATSMANPDCGVPAPHSSDRPIEIGDAVVVELSGTYNHYSAQALRTYAVGSGLSGLFRELHDCAQTAFERVEAVLRHGSTVGDVLEAANLIEQSGYTIIDDLLHGANQSRPIVRTRSTSQGVDEDFTFTAGMAVVVQPNVATRDHRAGVQFGEMLIVRPDRAERIHHLARRAFEHVGG